MCTRCHKTKVPQPTFDPWWVFCNLPEDESFHVVRRSQPAVSSLSHLLGLSLIEHSDGKTAMIFVSSAKDLRSWIFRDNAAYLQLAPTGLQSMPNTTGLKCFVAEFPVET